MADILVIQIMLFSFFMVQTLASGAVISPGRGGYIMFYLPVDTGPQESTDASLVPGKSSIRRDDYTYVPGLNGYKIHTRAALWNDAREICQEEGGHLAIINSIAESNAISQIFNDSKPIIGSLYTGDALIGYHDLFHKGTYVTIHDESLQKAGFDLWDDGQPNNVGVQRCGGVTKNGLLNDLWCDVPFGFICEIPTM